MRRQAFAAGALWLVAGCAGQSGSQAPAAVPVAVASAQSAAFSQPVELSGTLSAVREATVGASTPGRVVSVAVRVGDRVTAGQFLAQIDASQYGAELAGARAGAAAAAQSRSAAGAQLAQARSRFELARTTAARMSSMYAQGAISKQQQDESQAALSAARAGVAQAQAGLSAASSLTVQAQAGVAAASVPLANATITAPFSGVVTQKFVEPGAVVGPGSPIVAVQNVSDLEVDVAVPEDDAGGLVPGQPVAVRVDALGGASIPAHVRAIVPSQNPALRSATVRIAVASRPGLLPGMFARVTVRSAARRAIGVPLAAVVTRAGQRGVFTIAAGTASFVPVQTGTVDGKLVEVDGLRAGTQVAVAGLARLVDGSAVTVTP
jgi:multidrug efflux pump subunit AcrA (membrane-fusion protein)